MVASIVSHIFSERIGMILLRTSGLVRASNTLSVIVFLVLGAFLGMMSVRSEIEFRRLICLFSCCSQPNISTSTPITNKRASPDSPDDLPATEIQKQQNCVRQPRPPFKMAAVTKNRNFFNCPLLL